MNPFTRSLALELHDPAVDGLVVAWDAIEALVVAVYKAGVATDKDEAAWSAAAAVARAALLPWADALAPHWVETRAGGQPVTADPFARLAAIPRASALVGNWAAMQTLPAAREALNRMLTVRLRQRG